MTDNDLLPHDDHLEEELRVWLRHRDDGPAPDRLRIRVARVTAEPAARPRIGSLFRPIGALAGVAAAALVILLAVSSRGPGGPMASANGSSPGPTSTASSYLIPELPYGAWPRTGPVLAIPLDGPAMMALVFAPLLVAILLVVFLARRSFADAQRLEAAESAPAGGWRIRSRPAPLARFALVLVAAGLVVTSLDLFQFGQSTPLTYGSGEGWGSQYLGSRPGTGSGFGGEAYDRFVPGGQIQLGIDLRNEGSLPLTVTSFDFDRFVAEQGAGAFVSSVELRLPPGPSYGGSSGDSFYSESFHPFELPPGAETVLLLVLHLKECRNVLPGPTAVAPALASNVYLPTTGYVTFGLLPFRYSVLGIERETDVRMNESVGIVFGSDAVTC